MLISHAAEESGVINDFLSNGHFSPVDVFEDTQDSAVNRSVVSPQPPSSLGSSQAAISASFEFNVSCSSS